MAKQDTRATWNYEPGQRPALKLSRSRLQLFLDCPRCFWLVMRRRIKRPPIADYLLNETVDLLLKREFDAYRQRQAAHPIIKEYKLDALPFAHDDLDRWRNPFDGVQHLDEQRNLLLFGGIDDVWHNKAGELMVVDYKATARNKPVTELYPEGGYHDAYRHQLDFYSWLLEKNGFRLAPTAYFVYATADKNKAKFTKKLHFDLKLIAHEVRTDWIEPALSKAKECLDGDMPKYRQQPKCDWCGYVWQRLSSTRSGRSKA